MNSIERVLAALQFGKGQFRTPDRVPVIPVALMHGALVHRCTVAEYFEMPAARIAAAQIELVRLLDGIPDAVAGFPNVIEDVAAFGVGLKYHYQNSTPAVDRMLITDYAQISKLQQPAPLSARELSKTCDTIAALAAKLGSEKVVLGACIAPFSLPSMLMGTSKWMRLLFTKELRQEYLKRLLAVCQDFVVAWATAQLKAGAHLVVLADGMASATLLPRAVFEDFALPLTRETIRRIPGFVGYEAVGRIQPFVDLCPQLGAAALLIGQEDDISRCKQALAGKLALIGNINNIKMRRWSAARIELQAKRAICQGKPGYGFILANQGPEIPFDVTLEKIGTLCRVAERFGRYTSATATPPHESHGSGHSPAPLGEAGGLATVASAVAG